MTAGMPREEVSAAPSRRRVLHGLAATAAVLAGAWPSPGGRAAAAVEVSDMRGRRISLAGPPARIVSLAPSMTEIVYALGAASSLAGVTDFCDYPPDARRKLRVGGMSAPNLEVILTLKPDLVLATPEGNREEDVLALERLRIPVFVVTPVDFASVLESVARIGAAIAREAEARRLVAEMSGRADAIARAVARVGRPRVLYVIWGNPLIVAGRDTLITDLLRRAGGESITGDEPAPYPRFAMEEVVARAPDWIIIGQHSDIPVEARLREWRGLTLLAAAREGRVRAVDGDLVHRPGPRIVEGLTALARILHPDLVP